MDRFMITLAVGTGRVDGLAEVGLFCCLAFEKIVAAVDLKESDGFGFDCNSLLDLVSTDWEFSDGLTWGWIWIGDSARAEEALGDPSGLVKNLNLNAAPDGRASLCAGICRGCIDYMEHSS